MGSRKITGAIGPSFVVELLAGMKLQVEQKGKKLS
jgi:hypothetical protein